MRLAILLAVVLSGCASTRSLVIDRFSAKAGHLQVRTRANGLPGPGAPIDFDHAPLITQSRGPGGQIVRYYNFDVQPTTPGTIYVLVDGGGRPVVGQAAIVAAIPGEAGYSDFVRVVEVTVPSTYAPDELRDAGALKQLPQRVTGRILNRPIVPAGSVARERLSGASPIVENGWCRGARVSWLRFDETALTEDGGRVPTSPIYVTFNVNPGAPGGGPPSGFRTEPGGVQTHNVASSIPGDLDYSPLWLVSVYDNASFPAVHDETTLQAARIVAPDVATVNCPIVYVEGAR